MAQWIRHLTSNQGIVGSSPTGSNTASMPELVKGDALKMHCVSFVGSNPTAGKHTTDRAQSSYKRWFVLAVSSIYPSCFMHTSMSFGGVLFGMVGVLCVFICILWNCSPSYRRAVIMNIEGDYHRHKDDDYEVKKARDVLNQEEISDLESLLRHL